MKSPRPWIRIGLLLALWAGLPSSAAAETGPSDPPAFYVANWNVENLFDTIDDPRNRFDNEFLPNNPTTHWTRARFDTKLDNLAQVITGMNRNQGPDILGLEEVENALVLQSLVDKMPGKSFGIVHVDSPDPRGIDTALLFNRDRFSLVATRTYAIALQGGHTTRDILHAVLADRAGQQLHVLVNHWPSRGGGAEESEGNRFAAARTLSKAIGKIFQQDPAAHVIALGDFNDEPSSQSIRVVLDVAPYPSLTGYAANKLYNLATRQSAKGWGSFFHSFRGDGQWRMYDQIMASGTLLQKARIEKDEVPFWIDKPEYMSKAIGRDQGSPVPTYENQDYYLGGYSDHFPVGARFVYLKPGPPVTASTPKLPAAPPHIAPNPLRATPSTVVVW